MYCNCGHSRPTRIAYRGVSYWRWDVFVNHYPSLVYVIKTLTSPHKKNSSGHAHYGSTQQVLLGTGVIITQNPNYANSQNFFISLCCNLMRETGLGFFRCRSLASHLTNLSLLLSFLRCGTSYQSNPATLRLTTHKAQHVVHRRDVTTGHQMKAVMYDYGPNDLCPLVSRTIPQSKDALVVLTQYSRHGSTQ